MELQAEDEFDSYLALLQEIQRRYDVQPNNCLYILVPNFSFKFWFYFYL